MGMSEPMFPSSQVFHRVRGGVKVQPHLCWADREYPGEQRWRTEQAHLKPGHLLPLVPIEKLLIIGLKPGEEVAVEDRH